MSERMATRRRSGDESDPITTANGEGGGERPGEAEARRPLPAPPRTGDFLGKHRLNAAINRLNQEIQNLEDELNELETMEPSSASCQEAFLSTEGKPDPLLPITPGPENAAWDRWFHRVRSPHSHKWWAHKGSSDIS